MIYWKRILVLSLIIFVTINLILIFTQDFFLNPILEKYRSGNIFSEDEGAILDGLKILSVPIILISFLMSLILVKLLKKVRVQ